MAKTKPLELDGRPYRDAPLEPDPGRQRPYPRVLVSAGKRYVQMLNVNVESHMSKLDHDTEWMFV